MNLYFRLLRLLLTSSRRAYRDMWETGVTRYRVQPSDLDTVGHMNNAKYLALMDLGRVDLMLRSGSWKRTREQGWYPVVAAQTIRYRRSLQPWQRFELHTRVLGVDERAIYMEQEFRVGSELYARAVVECRFLRKRGGSVPTSEIVGLFGGLPEDRVLPDWVRDWAAGVRQSA